MKNKEKYEKEIMELACNGRRFAVDKNTNEVLSCSDISCDDCAFKTKTCSLKKREKWAEAECKEPLTAERLENEYEEFAREMRGQYINKFAWLLEHYAVKEKEASE